MIATAVLETPIAEDAKLKNPRLLEVQNRVRKEDLGWIGYKSSNSTTGEKVWSRYLYFKFRVNGTPKQVNTETNDPEKAYRQLVEAHKAIKDGDKLLEKEVSRLRYEDLIKLLIDDYRERGVASLFTRKTEDGGIEYTFGGKDDLDAFFKRMPITDISALKIKAFIKSQRDLGVADPTIRRRLGALRSAFTLAKKHDLITDNHIPSFVMPEDSKPRNGFLDLKDFNKLLAAFPDNLQPTVLFLYYSGCRTGAAQQITWSMVNSDCTEIHAPGSIIKNETDWGIPLVGPLKPISDALKKIRGKAIQEADKQVFDFTNFRKVWNQTCQDLGLGKYITEDPKTKKATQRYSGLHPHDFRRSAARNLIKEGVLEQIAMKITGHKTAAIFRRYNIQNLEDVKDALIQVGKRAKVQAIRGGK